MRRSQYIEMVQYLQEIREDVRFHRDLSWQLVQQQGTIIVETVCKQSNMLKTLRMLQNIGEYEFVHPIRVAIIASYIGKWLQMEQEQLFELAYAGLLADIGKAKVKDSLLNKTSALTDEEWVQLRQHPIRGFHFIAQNGQISAGVKMAVLCHHERYDGSGYPFGLKNDETHVYAKIIAVADIFDAMISDRIYCERSSVFHAVEEILESGFGNLDPLICQTFFQKICKCYIGVKVILSNDMIGEIVYVNPLCPNRPLVRGEDGILDLLKRRDIEIIDIA